MDPSTSQVHTGWICSPLSTCVPPPPNPTSTQELPQILQIKQLDNMGKFGKAFKLESIPEWAAGYMNYEGLKQCLHQISRADPGENDGSVYGSSEALLEVGRGGGLIHRGSRLGRSQSEGAAVLKKELCYKYIDVRSLPQFLACVFLHPFGWYVPYFLLCLRTDRVLSGLLESLMSVLTSSSR